MTQKPFLPTHRFTKQEVVLPLSHLSWFTIMADSDEEAYQVMVKNYPELGWSQLQRRTANGTWEFCI